MTQKLLFNTKVDPKGRPNGPTKCLEIWFNERDHYFDK